MLRTLFTAASFAAFGAVAIAPIRERVQDQLWQPTEAYSVGLVSLAAALLVAFVLLMREPRRAGWHQPSCCGEALRPAPPTGGSGVKPPSRSARARKAKGD